MIRRLAVLVLASGAMVVAGCRGQGGAPAAKSADAAPLQFWHTQTQENNTALEGIVKEFNESHPGLPVQATYIGNYPQLYEKIRASAAQVKNRVLPDLAVAYESMIADYMTADIVRPLDDLVADPTIGLNQESLDDFHPAYLETNRFQQFGGQLLSFPFTKSNLMLFYNATMLEQAGVGVPGTWEEFEAACRAIRQKRGITPLASAIDPSTMDGMILSMGGTLVSPDGQDALFDSAESTAVFELLDRLYRDKLAYQVVEKGDQNNDFANGKCAFFFRSSTARPFIADLAGDQFKWGLTGLPVKAGRQPVTVMFGANICVLKSSPERERRAWEFINFFTSTDITARWAMATGYLPVRKSAAETPAIAAFFAAAPQNRAAFDLLPVAVPEPNVAGWQAVRDCLETAETSVATQLKPPGQVVKDLNACADAALRAARE